MCQMNKFAKKAIALCISIFLISYVIYQVYAALRVPAQTRLAVSSTVTDSFSVEGFVLHSETTIKSTASGIVDYVREDGERVKKGGVVANVYASPADASTKQKIQQLQKQIDQLNAIGSYTEAAALDVRILDAKIKDEFLALAQASHNGDVKSLDKNGATLLASLNRKQLATGELGDIDAQLDSLYSQLASLQSQLSGSVKAIAAPVSGYFVSSVDGYEGIYETSKISSLTVSDINGFDNKKAASTGGAVGKIVEEFQWYITAVLNASQAEKINPGDSVRVNFPLSVSGQVPVTVAVKNRAGDGSFAVALSCDYISSQLASLRKQDMQIVTKSYSGIRVNSGEIHIVDGVKGVYTLKGNAVRFKTVDVIYSTQDFVISKVNALDSGSLQVNDQIITGGGDLYDGKIL
jgi:putative membrane fusion protein